MNSKNILKRHFEEIRLDIIKRQNEIKAREDLSQGMRASGEFERSLGTKVVRSKAELFAVHYVEQLVDGREPGKFPPISAIEKWIHDKGIVATIRDEISVSSLAFLIARKIAEEGTEYYKQGGTDLVSSVITPQRIQLIIDEVSEFYIVEFTSEIKSVFEELSKEMNK